MPKDKTLYTEVACQVVRQSPEPLLFDEIMRRIHAIKPITNPDPASTIRWVIGRVHSIVAIGDGRYGWKPRLINGSTVRHVLSRFDLGRQAIALVWGNDVMQALWPAHFDFPTRQDRSPASVQLPGGGAAQLSIDFWEDMRCWVALGSPEFCTWFKTLPAAPGDSLIFHVLDGEARLYQVEFEPGAARDQVAIAERNEAIQQAVQAFRPSQVRRMLWRVSAHLLVVGLYRHPTPPDPLEGIWAQVIQRFERGRDDKPGSLAGRLGQAVHEEWTGWTAGEKIKALLESAREDYDCENPPDLPIEYLPGPGRRPRPSRKARQGSVRTFVLRVNHRELCEVWRDIEIAEDQTLEDLHLIIQRAFRWNDDHLYSFFMSGEAQDRQSEMGSPWSNTTLHTHQVEIGSLELEEGQEFLYLFDYGDQHEFSVYVEDTNLSVHGNDYPRIIAAEGEAPAQYPVYLRPWGDQG